jgi:hypothetical protein
MTAAEGWGNRQGFADLNFTREALYLLAGPSVPKEVREIAIAHSPPKGTV